MTESHRRMGIRRCCLASLAGVYDIGSDGDLAIRWDLSRRMAVEIEKAYREPLEGGQDGVAGLREEAAEVLQRFATRQCRQAAAPAE